VNASRISDTQATYDTVAEQYTKKFLRELDHKPFDRQLLERFAERVRGRGRVCDLGCGPGQIARYLRVCGVDSFGLDLSPRMVEIAQRLNPGIEFVQGDMCHLDFDGGALAGIAAFYSIIHIPRADVTDVLREMRRVLQPGGLLLLSFHQGDEDVHVDEWWEKPVSLDAFFFQPEEMAGYLRTAGFLVDEIVERESYPDVEYPSRRVYILALNPGG
jgi:SAM-dependent methyltransferase